MGLQRELVFRCDLCKRQLEREEYFYPWRWIKGEVFWYLCKGCHFVTESLLEVGWLTDWKWINKELSVDATIYHKGVKEEWISPK